MHSSLLNENIDINYKCKNKKPILIGVADFKKAVSDYYYNENEDLEVLASNALKQIDLKKYDTEMVSKKINRVTKIGIAFFGKKASVKRG